MPPLVSVIIPVYNRAHTLHDCTQSLLCQTLQNIEVLFIDDGSTDATVSVCQEFVSADPRFRLLQQSHSGVSAARNIGLDMAKGRYCFFLDSDDAIHPMLLETLVLSLESTNATMAGSGIVNIPQKHWKEKIPVLSNDTTFAKTFCLTYLETLARVFRESTPFNLIGGVMIRRDYIGNTRFSADLFIGEDFYFIYQNLIKGGDTVFLVPKWYFCRIHDQNSSWNYSFEAFWSRFHRRELVWLQEESFGRDENARWQKMDACGICLNALLKSPPSSLLSLQIRNTMHSYLKALLPALSFKGKLHFLLALYLPEVNLRLTTFIQKMRRKR